MNSFALLLFFIVQALAHLIGTKGVCIAPNLPFGYDGSSKKEISLNRGCEFQVTGWRCSSGFTGIAKATECSGEGKPYTLSGCTSEQTTFCKLIDPQQCYGTLHEFVLDGTSEYFPTGDNLFGGDKDGDQDPAITAGGYHDVIFADLDADGDLDLIIPNTGSYSLGSESTGGQIRRRLGRVRYFENLQTTDSPHIPWRFKEIYGKDANPFHDLKDNFEMCQMCRRDNSTCMNDASCANYIVDPDPRVGWIYPFSYLHLALNDIDGDDDLDAVVGTYEGHLLYYENKGNRSTPKFVSVDLNKTNHPLGTVSVSGFSAPVFVDADGDGDDDLVVGMGSGSLAYYERVTTASSQSFSYEHRTDASSNPFYMISVGGRSKPVFTDITGDNILDLVVSGYDGSITLHANTGSAANPAYTIRKSLGKNPFLAVQPVEYVSAVFVDVDGDGHEDMVTGDISVSRIRFFRHLTTARSIFFQARDAINNPFFVTVGSGDRDTQRSAPFIADIDGDDDGDLLVGSMEGHIHFFENVGASPQVPNFVRRTDSYANPFFEFRNILPWENTVPFLVDLDADLDDDLVVASSPESGSEPRQLFYFENIGTASSARFNFTYGLTNLSLSQKRDSPFSNLDISTRNSKDKLKPSFADLDNDGDYDMVIGTVSGAFLYFINNGTESSPDFVRLSEQSEENPVRALDRSLSWSSPELVDLDGDADIDLVVGLYDGTIRYFENVGTQKVALFQEREKTASENPFHGIDVSHYAISRIFDCNGDGSQDLLVGEYAGSIHYYERNGCNVPHLCSGLGTCLPNEERDRAECSCLPSITGYRCESCNAGTVEKRRTGGLSLVVPQNPVCQPIPAGAWSNKTGLIEGEAYLCPAGKFSSVIGAISFSQCIVCSKGMYSDKPGMTSCLPCLSGKFTNRTGETMCHKCARGRKSQNSNATGCLGCNKGYFQNKIGKTSCLPCLPGEFGDKEAMHLCDKCPSGRYSKDTNSTSCSYCAKGRFTDTMGATLCLPCLPGKFANNTGMAICHMCTPGQFAASSNSSLCFKCSAGKFSRSLGSAECTACGPGRYNIKRASTSCSLCPKGWFQNLSMQSSCVHTTLGQYQSGLGSVAPIQIAEGWHGLHCDGNYGAGCKASRPCKIGYRGTIPPSAVCLPCLPGRTTAAAGAIACQMCATGKVAPEHGSKECVSCNALMPKNEYASDVGSTKCSVCPSGFISQGSDCKISVADPILPVAVKIKVRAFETEDKRNNDQPGRGLFITWDLAAGATGYSTGWSSFEVRMSASPDFPLSSESKRTFTIAGVTLMSLKLTHSDREIMQVPLFDRVLFIKIRVVGKDGHSVGAWSATTVPWLSTSSCSDDEFLDTSVTCSTDSPSDPACWKCSPCPRGSSCKGPMTWSRIPPLFGWWKIPLHERASGPPQSGENGHDTLVFTKCRYPPACPGAPNPEFFNRFFDEETGEDLARVATKFDLSANVSQPCAHKLGYRNGSRLCDACMPLFQLSRSNQCEACPEASANYVLIVGGAFLLVIIVIGIGAVRINANGKQALSESLMKIVLNYLQVASLFLMFPLEWPPAMLSLFSFQGAFSTLGKHLINPDCVAEQTQGLKSAAALLYAKQIAMLTSGLALGFSANVFFRCLSFRQTGDCYFRKRRTKDETTVKDQMVVVVCAVAFFVFPTLCIQTFELFECVQVGKSLYLEQALDEQCWAGRHATMVLVLGYPQLILFVVGLPTVALVFLKRNKHKLDSHVVMTRYGMFFSGYKRSRYFWEVWIAIRKVLLCALSVFGKQLGPHLQAQIAILILGISIAAEIALDPWDHNITPRHKILPVAEARALTVQWLTMWAGLVMYTFDGFKESQSTVFFIGVAGVCINIALISWMVFHIGKSMREEAKNAKGVLAVWINGKLHVITRKLSRKFSVTERQPRRSRKADPIDIQKVLSLRTSGQFEMVDKSFSREIDLGSFKRPVTNPLYINERKMSSY